ncbi:MAG: hypothetical protein ASARMPRED_007011 [Alectoria sarmentosa]|nr:MAG: hypothetical protein ASARMPRED_007011 [Alectoria sarmentosa]
MSRDSILWTAFSTVVASAASVLQSLQSIEIDPSPSLNQSHQSYNESIQATMQIRCDGQQYGRDLNIEECKQAFQSITRSSQQISFGQRRTAETYDVNVPYRFSSDNDDCVIDIGLAPSAQSTYGSFIQVAQAASVVIETCVRTNNPTGGIAWKVAPSGLYDSCTKLLDTIRATTTKSIFGTKGLPGVQFYLRFLAYHNGPPTSCALAIDADHWMPGFKDSESWYDIWEEATAMLVICIKHGSLPLRSALGDRGRLRLFLGEKPPKSTTRQNTSQLETA